MKYWKFGIMLIILLSATMVSGQAYTYEGTLSENGDEYWDSNEVEFYEFELTSQEAFEFTLTGEGDLDLIIYKGDDDLDGFNDVMTTGNGLHYVNMDLDTNIDDTYTPASDATVVVAIFSFLNPSGSYDFTLGTNLEASTGFLSFNFLPIILGFSAIAFIAIRRRR